MWFVKIQSALLPLWRAKYTQPVLATLSGVLLYLWLPLFKAPDWLVQLNSLSPEAQQQQLKPLNSFYKKYGDTAFPALHGQLELDKLRRYEQQLIDDNKNFDDQDRDELWAEATEFMIAHLTQNVANNQLRLLDSECRNNLCRMVLEAPKGLTPEYRALVLKLAGSLKTGDLEFAQLTEGNKRIMLELKSDKRLKYGYFATRKLNPPEKAQWQAQIKNMVTINKTAMQPYLQKAILIWRDLATLLLAVVKQLVSWLKKPDVQRAALRNIALMIGGYLLMLCLFFFYSLSLNTPDTLPAPVAQQLQQQDVSLEALNEAVTRLEKKKALAKL